MQDSITHKRLSSGREIRQPSAAKKRKISPKPPQDLNEYDSDFEEDKKKKLHAKMQE